MDYIVTIKFKNKNETAPKNINRVIELLPVAYKTGHTQKNMLDSMYPTKNYDISFRANKEAAERFRITLFQKHGNLLDIKCNYM